MKLNKLTSEEKRIMVDKGTEPPFSGEYDDFFAKGRYECRPCGAFLYRSEDKFQSRCGWPAFDDAVLGAVQRTANSDGRRMEIMCRRCGGHLGHVFEGEWLTNKDVRHCVNSLSMRFKASDGKDDFVREAYFGGGCFWCVESAFAMIRGVLEVTSGYAGGTTADPTYEEVSQGDTGHAEVVCVKYDSSHIAYEALLDIFFAVHDSTTPNRQGNDVGTQYRSIILCATQEEEEIARRYMSELEKEHVFDAPIVTEIARPDRFYSAEEYHQQYFRKNPHQAYCQATIPPKIAKLKSEMKTYLQ